MQSSELRHHAHHVDEHPMFDLFAVHPPSDFDALDLECASARREPHEGTAVCPSGDHALRNSLFLDDLFLDRDPIIGEGLADHSQSRLGSLEAQRLVRQRAVVNPVVGHELTHSLDVA